MSGSPEVGEAVETDRPLVTVPGLLSVDFSAPLLGAPSTSAAASPAAASTSSQGLPQLSWQLPAHQPVASASDLLASMSAVITDLTKASDTTSVPVVTAMPVPPPPTVDLSRLPDANVGDGPTTLPRITMASPDVVPAVEVVPAPVSSTTVMPAVPAPVAPVVAAAPAAPAASFNLSAAEVFSPKTSAQPARASQGGPPLLQVIAPSKKKHRGRRIVRTLFSLLVAFAMLGGGLFALKKYVLDAAKWTDETRPIATSIETNIGLKFRHPVMVEELDAASFGGRRGSALVGLAGDDLVDAAAQWRAIGVLGGGFDESSLAAVGSMPSLTSSAFYDAADGMVYVTAGATPNLRASGLRHALAMALVDQNLSAAPEGAVGATTARRLYADAVADYDLEKFFASEAPETGQARISELSALPQPTQAIPAFVTYLSGQGQSFVPLALADGPAGAALRRSVTSDAAVFDLSFNLLDISPVSTTAGTTTQGVMFWYHALASRLDDSTAWRAATQWRGDSTVVSTVGLGRCIDSTIFTGGSDASALVAALGEWAAGSPTSSKTTVTPGESSIAVHTCDPGADVVVAPDAAAATLGGAPIEHMALANTLALNPQTSVGVQNCVVTQIRELGLAADLEGRLSGAIELCTNIEQTPQG